MFENSRRGRQARNFTTNVPKILDLKLSSEQIFSENWRWVPLKNYTNKQIKLKWTAAPSNNFFKILAGIMENYPYAIMSVSFEYWWTLATTTRTTTLFQYPTLIYMIQKHRYKYGESTGCRWLRAKKIGQPYKGVWTRQQRQHTQAPCWHIPLQLQKWLPHLPIH